MQQRSDKNIFRLEHVLEAIDKIERLTSKISLSHFLEDWVVQDAVIRNIEIIGEALKSVDDNLKSRYPDVPWAQAKAMRNLLAHEYFRVNPNEVWVTVKESLPELKVQISKILEHLKPNNSSNHYQPEQ